MLMPSRNGKLILSCVLAFAVGMSGSCSDGWTPSPSNAAWGSACYKSVGPATTIGECNELCGVGAAPVLTIAGCSRNHPSAGIAPWGSFEEEFVAHGSYE